MTLKIRTWLRFCDQSQYDIPWQTIVKVSGMYPIWKSIRLAAVYQRLPYQSSGSDVQRDVHVVAGPPELLPITRALVPGLTTASISCSSPPPDLATAEHHGDAKLFWRAVNEPGTSTFTP